MIIIPMHGFVVVTAYRDKKNQEVALVNFMRVEAYMINHQIIVTM